MPGGSETKQQKPKKKLVDREVIHLQPIAQNFTNEFNNLLRQREGTHTSCLRENFDVSEEYRILVGRVKGYLRKPPTKRKTEQHNLVSREFKNFKVQFSGSMNDRVQGVGIAPDSDIIFKTGDNEANKLISKGMRINGSNWPLFPWKPCPADLKQGILGDCWLEATLASLANKHPDWIENSLKDNGDGTVTGRIYDRYDNQCNRLPQPSIKYYRVEKTILLLDDCKRSAFSKNCCLWPEMIRKILAVHIREKEGPKKDKNGALYMPKVSYESLHGGNIFYPNRKVFEMFSGDCIETVSEELFGDILSILDIEGYEFVISEEIYRHINELLDNAIIDNYDYENQLNLLSQDMENQELKEQIFSDQNYGELLKLLKQPIVREILGEDFKNLIRLILSQNYYDILKDEFEKSDGLMTCKIYDNQTLVYIRQKQEKQKYLQNAQDILGKIEASPQGLLANHLYSILDLEEQEQDDQRYYFVKIRNPWGRYVRNDEIKNGRVITQVIEDNSTDGIGRIEILDFIKCFDRIFYNTEF